MKKIVLMVMVFCVVGMVGCGKDDGVENGGDGGNGEVVKHNVELVYGDSFQNISFDTLRKYNADPSVDTIFMVLVRETVFSGLSLNTTLKLCDSLEVRHNINQNKIFGKGTMNLQQTSVNERVRDVIENKLKYKIREF